MSFFVIVICAFTTIADDVALFLTVIANFIGIMRRLWRCLTHGFCYNIWIWFRVVRVRRVWWFIMKTIGRVMTSFLTDGTKLLVFWIFIRVISILLNSDLTPMIKVCNVIWSIVANLPLISESSSDILRADCNKRFVQVSILCVNSVTDSLLNCLQDCNSNSKCP